MVVLLAELVGILGGLVVSYFTIGLHPARYINSVWLWLSTRDIYISLLKAFVFGSLIALVCATQGYETTGGAKDVGESTTKAAVLSTVYMLIANFIITIFLAILFDAYHEDTLEDGTTREVLSLHPYLAPYKVAVLPLVKKYHSDKAMEVYRNLSKHFMTTYDESGNIGKRYRREDVIGTPFCITIDDETLNNNTVTIRHRDTMEQITLPIDEVIDYINKNIEF